jgi:cyclic pyranopterin phosphate synthase
MKPIGTDLYGRPLQTLRISITDRCNLRCQYCMPAEIFGPEFKFLPRRELLSYEEIRDIVSAFVAGGVRHVRITGGEPLLRRDVAQLIALLHNCAPELDLSLTTNGLRLAPMANELADAGLQRINISLDAWDKGIASVLAGRPVDPESVLKAALLARDQGMSVKINTVLRKGLNESEIIPLARQCRESAFQLRFIEYMDVGQSNDWRRELVVTGATVHRILSEHWPLEPASDRSIHETAKRFLYCDNGLQVGFINSVSEPFCRGCDRARISAEGVLYTCLFASHGVSIKDWIRKEKLTTAALLERLNALWGKRTDRYSEERSSLPETANRIRPEMWSLGG